jgi:pyridinium-3,5-bisthiocarboxylic acid mononucleotide nickel chelatase
MTKAVYFDLFAGCSGDMILGSLLDAGLPLEDLANGLAALPLEGYRITQQKVKRGAMSATLAQVSLEYPVKHDRSYKDIAKLISSSKLSEKIKKQVNVIFHRLGEAEAKIHGVTLDKVHFHEVGAVDSLIDIVGSVIGFDLLGITQFYSAPFPLAMGSVECRHGTLPLPAPATLNLIATINAPVINPPHAAMEGMELVTPTGAAIITTLAKFQRPFLNLATIGYGAGSRDPSEYPNVIRLWIGETSRTNDEYDMVLLETNIDDMNPQIYDYVMEKLFKQGALDVWLTPIQMKKNRPALMLSVLAPGDLESLMAETLIRETTTLGIRVRPIYRHMAGREIIELDSSYGKVKIKVKRFKEVVLSMAPEYDDCRRIASEQNIPLKEVHRTIEAEARKFLAL